MEKKTILAVDDEIHILELLKYNLETNGYYVITVETGEEALELLTKEKIDAVLLDLMLPKIDGLEVLRRIRSTKEIKKIPVILLTAKSDEFDKVLGLETGADDYIAKPFSVRELQARVKAVLRRVSEEQYSLTEKKLISTHGLEIGLETKTVKKHGVPIEMSLKEFELLKFLAENPGKVYSRDVLLEKIWSYEYIGETRTVDVHIRHIRKKIEEDDSTPIFIKTVRGFGYKFRED
ncbi:response regulator transcription factor [Clostridium sp. MD294]|uniref:response regulator transcription factor n=1 Tax=Clostridium sp. MD294 TaxID=97138 RepID=UPI0002CAC6CD|nr:response regulator transcription factor [Clostridium sp. MD294]NDO45725.1 response regulator transcription factor [Clostridium sp. MD294]USF30621.1 Alkaline phosphatase synthesis transcriptional regulatory protein PhoP [Clostridium sp. MD294]